MVISGLRVRVEDEGKLREAVQVNIEKELNLKVIVINAHKVGNERYVSELEKWEDKLKIRK